MCHEIVLGNESTLYLAADPSLVDDPNLLEGFHQWGILLLPQDLQTAVELLLGAHRTNNANKAIECAIMPLTSASDVALQSIV